MPRKASGGATGSSTTSGPQPPTAASSAKLKPIPYRDSKLTFLLRDCLGGNAYTTLIGTTARDWSSFLARLFGRVRAVTHSPVWNPLTRLLRPGGSVPLSGAVQRG